MRISKENIEIISNYFKDKSVLKAYLFRSHVRNEAQYDSDVDILVDLDYTHKIGLIFIKMPVDLEELLDTKVDLVSSNGISKYIKPIVDKEKQLIYAR
jgi:predicted nucleotidyltransferase